MWNINVQKGGRMGGWADGWGDLRVDEWMSGEI